MEWLWGGLCPGLVATPRHTTRVNMGSWRHSDCVLRGSHIEFDFPMWCRDCGDKISNEVAESHAGEKTFTYLRSEGCSFRMCWPWVRGGWGLDALGKCVCHSCHCRLCLLRALRFFEIDRFYNMLDLIKLPGYFLVVRPSSN